MVTAGVEGVFVVFIVVYHKKVKKRIIECTYICTHTRTYRHVRTRIYIDKSILYNNKTRNSIYNIVYVIERCTKKRV